jgi:DNA repair photolyase
MIPMTTATKRTGTREWSDVSFNCMRVLQGDVGRGANCNATAAVQQGFKSYVGGCEHGCRYCYARSLWLDRFKTIREGDWEDPSRHVPDAAAIAKPWRFGPSVVMFPTHHDITPRNIGSCVQALRGPLNAHRRVLVVTKAGAEVVGQLREELGCFRDLLEFRFTITALDPEITSWWEPGAPAVPERLAALHATFGSGFRTSVSCEPCLAPVQAAELLRVVAPSVTESVWFGMLNKIDQRVHQTDDGARAVVLRMKIEQSRQNWQRAAAEVEEAQSVFRPRIVRWKDSLQELLRLPRADAEFPKDCE